MKIKKEMPDEVKKALSERPKNSKLNLFEQICTKFFNIPYPWALTSKGWRLYREYLHDAHPIYYFIVEKLGHWFQINIIWSLSRKYNKIKGFIAYRTYDKYHSIKTGLKPDYYEIHTLMLHGMFNLLKDFVEVEKAHMQKICHPTNNNKHESNRDLGFMYLDWESGLTHEADYKSFGIDPDPKYTGPTPQALTAIEIKKLYTWWVDERPKRKDPWENEKLNSLPNVTLEDICEGTDPNKDDRSNCYDEINKLEEQYHQEDEDMLIRLIKIRLSLWT